jgi:starch-binding outer membrane protein, SusD/RagB family
MRNQFKILAIAFLYATSWISSGCEKFVVVEPPPNALATAFVFDDDKTAEAAMLGVYERMMGNATGLFNGALELYAGLSGDELMARTNNPDFLEFNLNSLLPTNKEVKNIWQAAYEVIYSCNAIIEGTNRSTRLSERIKTQVKGEAILVRAFSYWQLLQLFGDVPLALSTDYRKNASMNRTEMQLVLTKCEQDLMVAKDLLRPDYQFSNGERTRPNKFVARALLARIYLLEGKWQEAILEATAIIDTNSLFTLSPTLDGVFQHNSQEAIWQLMPVIPNMNTGIGYIFVQQSAVPAYADIKADFLQAFDPDDQRAISWIYTYNENGVTYHVPNKYRIKGGEVVEEYYMLIRLAEIYLIRAEASLQTGQLATARVDMNLIRNRAGLSELTAGNKDQLTEALELERSRELFVEGGHRWFDLKRWGKTDAVMSAAKPADWHSYAAFYPIPKSELDNNTQLLQNVGY